MASQIWNLLNKTEILNTIDLAKDTLYKYVDILQGTFVIHQLNPFYKNIRKELSKMPKIYFHDLWVRNIIVQEIDNIAKKIDLWNLVENFVLTQYLSKYDTSKLYYYQTISKSEIDFIVEKEYELYDIVEVKYRNKVLVPIIFEKFNNKYNTKNQIILTKNILKIEGNIKYIPVYLMGFVEV